MGCVVFDYVVEPKLARDLLVQARTHPCKPEAILTVPIAETEMAAELKDVPLVGVSDRQFEQVSATPAFAQATTTMDVDPVWTALMKISSETELPGCGIAAFNLGFAR